MKTYKKVITHRLHLDEVVAIVLALIFGHKAGIDISKAKIEISFGNDLPDGKTSEDLDREGVLCIGEGGGRFDEHGKHGATAQKCAAVLMAEFLGVADHPTLNGILKEICDFDRHPTATKTALGTVIKDRFIAKNKSMESVINWAILGVRDMVTFFLTENAQMRVDFDAYSAVFNRAWQSASLDGHWTDEMYGRASRDFVASATNGQKLYSDLSYIYYYRAAMSGKEVADAWLYDAAYDAIVYQKKWFLARDEFIKNVWVEKSTALIDGCEVMIRVAMIKSDHEVMDKVYRSTSALKRCGRIDCLVQVKSSGNVAIFFNHQSKLHGDDLARMLRWAEISLSGRKAHGWEKLAKSDVLFFVPQWYYHRTDEIGKSGFYNGSLSHPLVQPTRINPEELLEIVCHAFHPQGVKVWRKRYNVFDDMSGHVPQARRAHKSDGGPKRITEGIGMPVLPADSELKAVS